MLDWRRQFCTTCMRTSLPATWSTYWYNWNHCLHHMPYVCGPRPFARFARNGKKEKDMMCARLEAFFADAVFCTRPWHSLPTLLADLASLHSVFFAVLLKLPDELRAGVPLAGSTVALLGKRPPAFWGVWS